MIPKAQHESRYDGTERWVTYLRDWGGQSQKTVTLVINDDIFVDPDETIVLQGTATSTRTARTMKGSPASTRGRCNRTS